MSTIGYSGNRFLVYCQVDGSCSLKQAATDAPAHHCADLVAAVNLAQDLKTASEMHITVYDSTGKVLLQSFG